MLDHVVVSRPVIGGMLRAGTEEGFDVMERGVEGSSRRPPSGGTAGKIKAADKLLVVLSNADMFILSRHV